MRQVRGALRALSALAWIAGGCFEEDLDNDRGSTLDGGLPDAMVEAGLPEAGELADANGALTPTCKSWTKTSGEQCGGAHCLQTLAELKSSAMAGAACGGDIDLATLCSLRGPDIVSACTQTALGDPAAITSCAMRMLGSDVSAPCLECYVRSADCAIQRCLSECIAGSATEGCDTCRREKGCASEFFTCAGLATPPIH